MTPQIESLRLDALLPYAKNTRTHTPAQIAKVASSIREFGWTNPILVRDDGTIVAGHARLQAAVLLRENGATIPNWPDASTAPCVRLSHLTEAQARMYTIADNRLALDAGWDEALLSIELESLKDEGVDLALSGFESDEIGRLLDADVDADNAGGGDDAGDDVPDAPENPVSVLGDVWILGKHRIVCGDSTSVEAVALALAGATPHLMVTDPPYGVEYDPSWRNDALQGSNTKRTGKVENDDRADWREAWALFPGAVAYVWHAGRYASSVQASLEACDFDIRSQIIWAKDRLVLSRGHYHWQHEPCWYAVRKSETGHWNGDRSQTTLWQIATKGQDSDTTPGTQKPIECMKRPIENNSSPGQAVYEPFSGSGTTIIAAEMTGRICHAIELSPAYVDVAVKRWQQFTGKKAVRERDGVLFDDLSNGGDQDADGR